MSSNNNKTMYAVVETTSMKVLRVSSDIERESSRIKSILLDDDIDNDIDVLVVENDKAGKMRVSIDEDKLESKRHSQWKSIRVKHQLQRHVSQSTNTSNKAH